MTDEPLLFLPCNMPPPLSSLKVAWSLSLAAVCFLSYLNSFSCGLVHDDIFAIVENEDLRQDTPLCSLFSNDFWGKSMSDPTSHKSYRPLTVLTFRINYYLSGLDAISYHVTNVLLHILCTLLVYWLGETIIFNKSHEALMTALLFGVHPIHTEAVTGVVGRADVLAGVFFISSFICYHYSMKNKSGIKLILCLILGCCSMLSKENGLTVFGVCLLHEIYAKIQLKIRCGSVIIGWSDVVRILLLFLTAAGLLVFRVMILHGTLPHFSVYDNPASFSDSLLTRVLTYCYLYYFNVSLLLYPAVLSYDWQMNSIPLIETVLDNRNICTCLLFIYLIFLFLASLPHKRNINDSRVAFLGMILLVVPFLPAANIFIRVGFVVAERILYIPSLGYCVLVVQGLKVLSNRISFKWANKFLLMLIIIIYMIRTMDRNNVWQTRETLFRSGVETLPHNSKVHYNYANYLKDAGQRESAIYHYREALKLSPDHYSTHNNLATLLDGSEAIHHLKETIRYNPKHYKAFFNLGNIMWNLKMKKKAESLYRECISINPRYTDALVKLASLLASEGKNDEAELLIMRSLQQKDRNGPDVLHNSAAVLMMIGNSSYAVSLWREAIAINPMHSEAMAGLARALRSLGRNEEAEEMFQRLWSLVIDPKAAVYQSLAGLYYNTNKLRESYNMFKKGLEMEPNNTNILCSFAHVAHGLEETEDLEKLVLIHPDSFCLHFNLAGILAKDKKRADKALVCSYKATQSAATDKERYDAFSLHATILKDSSHYAEAVKSFEKATEIFPNSVGAWINLGAAMHLMGSYREAEKCYMRAQSLEPHNTVVLGNLKKLQSLRAKKQS